MKKQVVKHPKPGPRLIGYARVSTEDQNLNMQIDALAKAGVHPDNIWSEHVSAAARRRPQLDLALIDVMRGDTLVVWKLDRFGRDVRDLLARFTALEEAGVHFRSLTEVIDTTSAQGTLAFHMAAAFAQFERDSTRERTRLGDRVARANGGKIGQPAKIVGKLKERVIRMIKGGKSVVQIAAAVRVAPGTIYNHFPASTIQAIREGRWEDEQS